MIDDKRPLRGFNFLEDAWNLISCERRTGIYAKERPLFRYSTDFDDTDEVPFGLGCGGTLTLLLEAAGTSEFELLMQVLERSLRGEEIRLSTTLPTSTRQLSRSLLNNRSQTLVSDEPLPFVECILPPPRLFVIGAGNDAQSFVRMAYLLGWRVVVVDGRTHLAQASRFPEAEQVVALGPENGDGLAHRPKGILSCSCLTATCRTETGFVISSRSDRGYLGLLGARQRSANLLREAVHSLDWTYEAAFRQVSTPARLRPSVGMEQKLLR